MRSIFTRAASTLLMALCLNLAGCAAFPQNEVPKVADMPSVAQYQHKPSVYLDVRLYSMVEPPATIDTNPSPGPRNGFFESIVGKAAGDSGLFASYSFDPAQKANADYTIRLYFYDHGNMGAAFAAGFITGFTFGVIPTAATDHYALRAAVVAKDGSQQALSMEDSVSTWMGIWFIPMVGNTPKDAVQQTIGNMTLAAFKQMLQANEIKYSMLDLPRNRF